MGITLTDATINGRWFVCFDSDINCSRRRYSLNWKLSEKNANVVMHAPSLSFLRYSKLHGTGRDRDTHPSSTEGLLTVTTHYPQIMPPPAVYVIAIVGGVAAAFAFKEVSDHVLFSRTP